MESFNNSVEDREIKKPRNIFESLNCAIDGIIYTVKHQRHIKYFFAIAAAALLASLALNLPVTDFALFSISIVILLFAEMVNSAIEAAVDLACGKKYHPLAKVAKDTAAGAVLISSTGVCIMSYIIFYKYLFGPLSVGIRATSAYTGHVAVVALLIVLIGVVAAKAYFGKGTPLHGGMPSGHAAVAFSLWAAVFMLTLNPIVIILTFVMATMVSHSRLVGNIHSRLEITLGSILGAGLTFLIFYLYSLIPR